MLQRECIQREEDRREQSFNVCFGGWEAGSKCNRRKKYVDTLCQDAEPRNPNYLHHSASPQKGEKMDVGREIK